MSGFPPTITIQPVTRFDASVAVPGSKSLTNRALLLAALAGQPDIPGESPVRTESGAQSDPASSPRPSPSRLTRVLAADDSAVMLDALNALGFRVVHDADRQTAEVYGAGGTFPAADAELFMGNAGTATRFLAAALTLGHGRGPYRMSGVARMHQRPIHQLVDPLRELGATITYDGEPDCPPLSIGGPDSRPVRGGTLAIPATLSSQYISALLQIGPCLPEGLRLVFPDGVISRPYIVMTLRLMEHFGAEVEFDHDMTYAEVKSGGYRPADYDIEPDASNATYFWAMAAVTGGRCTVPGLSRRALQGDVGFARVLETMGCKVEMDDAGITVFGPERGGLTGVDVDLNAMPDTAQTLAAVALFARGSTTMRGIGNLRVKETDRLEALRCELTKLGAHVAIDGETLVVTPPVRDAPQRATLNHATLDTYDDHRMAMSLSVAGIGAIDSPGAVTLNDPGCVAKTFPTFFEVLAHATGPAKV